MITLTRLQVRNYKSLCEIDLTFPRQASILVEGNNESGKSTLFEAVYFALYGEPLVAEELNQRGRKAYNSAIQYGADSATVFLALDVDGTVVEVTRTLRRDHASQAHLRVISPEGALEEVKAVNPVTSRILLQLGNLDKDSLLNSCFVEQKKLAKLEELDGSERRKSLGNLLNLKKLQDLEAEFKVTLEDRRATDSAQERLNLARAQAAVPVIEGKLEQVQQRIAATEMHLALEAISEHEALQVQLQARRQEIETERAHLAKLLGRIAAIKQVRETLRELITGRENLIRWEEEVSTIASQLENLDRREQEELPRLETRIEALDALGSALDEATRLRAERNDTEGALREAKKEQVQLKQREDAAQNLATQIANDETELQEMVEKANAGDVAATETLRHLEARRAGVRGLESLLVAQRDLQRDHQSTRQAVETQRAQAADYARVLENLRSAESGRDALRPQAVAAQGAYREAHHDYEQAHQASQRPSEAALIEQWLRGRRVIDTMAANEASMAAASERERVAATALESTEKELASARARFIVPTILGVITLIGGVVLLALGAGTAMPGGFLLVLGLLAAGYAARRRAATGVKQQAVREARASLDGARQAYMKIEVERSVAGSMGDGSAIVADAEKRLRDMGFTLPAGVSEADTRLRALRNAEATSPSIGPAELLVVAESKREEFDEARSRLQEAETRYTILSETAAKHPGATADDPGKTTLNEARLAELERQSGEAGSTINDEAQRLGIEPTRAAVQAALSDMEEEMRAQKLAASEVQSQRQAIAAREGHLKADRQALRKEQAWLADQDMQALEAKLAELEQQAGDLKQKHEVQMAVTGQQAAVLGVPAHAGPVRTALGTTTSQLDQLRKELSGRPALQRTKDALLEQIAREKDKGTVAWQEQLPLPEGLETAGDSLPSLSELKSLDSSLANRLAQLDELGVGRQQSTLDREEGEVEYNMQATARSIDGLRAQIKKLLREQKVSAEPTAEAIAAAYPLFLEVGQQDRDRLVGEREGLQADLEATRRRRDELAEKLGMAGIELDVATCETELAACKRQEAVKDRVSRIARQVSIRMMDKVLPTTEINMSMLLPVLTLDRYRDCRITPDYKLQIWDEQAGRYVAKNIFSGGTRDQFSLALRLAFALATLPQELGTTPGFIFLDEPLSSFDGPRTEALVNLLTRGEIAANFHQIFVISHSQMFDKSVFTHHLVMENGAVVENDFTTYLSFVQT